VDGSRFVFELWSSSPTTVTIKWKKRMRTSRIQAWYQNPKKHLIVAQFSNSPWTASLNPIRSCDHLIVLLCESLKHQKPSRSRKALGSSPLSSEALLDALKMIVAPENLEKSERMWLILPL
jgi:hypothetical protein